MKLLSELPVRIAFSLLRVSRTNPEEQAFVAMLLNSEEDLAKEKGPMAFPFFGRGRALEGLLGKGINADNVEGMSRFLCGACSCQVKRLNPGFDLLMAADWDGILENPNEKEPEKPSAEGQSVPIPSGRVERSEPPQLVMEVSETDWARGQTVLLPWTGVVAFLALLAVGAAALFVWRSSSNTER